MSKHLVEYAQFGTFQPALPEPGEIQVLDKPVESEKAAGPYISMSLLCLIKSL